MSRQDAISKSNEDILADLETIASKIRSEKEKAVSTGRIRYGLCTVETHINEAIRATKMLTTWDD